MNEALEKMLEKTVPNNVLEKTLHSAQETDQKKRQRKEQSERGDDGKRSKIGWKMNKYQGWTVPCQNYIITSISVNAKNKKSGGSQSSPTRSITPERFFEDFVAKRRPVVLQGEYCMLKRHLQY